MKPVSGKTDYYKVEKRLQTKSNHTQSDFYTDLANALPSGMYRLRVSHNESLHDAKWLDFVDVPFVAEFVNDRFCEILHVDRNVFLNNPGVINTLIHEDDKAGFARANTESYSNVTPFSWEGRFVIDGKITWLSLKSIPRVMDDKDIVWTGILDDVTERMHIEEQLRLRNAELTRLNSDKDRFMSILAHDLKSPFNAILGLLDLLLTDIRELEMDEIEEQLTVVYGSAHSAFNLLEDILLWARSHLGKIPFKPTEFSFKVFCNEVVDVLRSAAENKRISITIEESDCDLLHADMEMLKTVLRNLISNAIKFSHIGGSITIKACRNHRNNLISVRDNGVGISESTLSKLFHITKVYSSPGSAGETGTGLGLLLCKEFVEMHQGSIWVDSELGKGSTFHVELPLQAGV